MRYSRISLINPHLDNDKKRCVDDGHWVPINLLALASYLRTSGYTGEIQILDQQVDDECEMLEALDLFQPDLLGLSPNMDSYRKTIGLAARVKSRYGADVVLGGSYATDLARNILETRFSVDYIITRDGEFALKKLVWGDDLKSINNFVYRSGNKVCHNVVRYNKKASLSEIDYSLLDLNRYFDNYRKALHPGAFERPLAFMSQRGCVWREKSGGCVFCSRIEPFARFDDVNEVWSRLRRLRERFGIDSILEVSDDFLGDLDWFRAFHDARPKDLDSLGLRFIYARVNNISHETAGMLADLNTAEVCLGIESGDKEVLRKSVKGCSPSQQLSAMRLLEERGIKLIVSMLLGLPGENEDSLKNSYEHIERTLNLSNINELIISAMIPLPGSRAYDMLLSKSCALREKYQDLDFVPVNDMQKDWIEHFCDVDYDTVMEYLRKINSLSEKSYMEML